MTQENQNERQGRSPKRIATTYQIIGWLYLTAIILSIIFIFYLSLTQ
jgi:hypothetical protein